MSTRYVSSPVDAAHHQIKSELLRIPHSEVQLRLVSFSLHEISRAQKRINKIPELTPTEARVLYDRLLGAFVSEHDTLACAESLSQRRAA